MVETAVKTVRTIRGIRVKITPKVIVPISQAKMVGMLYQLNGSEIVTLHTLTDARLRKTSKIDKKIKNPYPNMKKYSIVNGLANINYENCVNNQLARENKENDFNAMPPQWGQAINDSKVLKQHINKDGEYNQYISFNPRNHIETRYYNDGVEIDKSEIEEFISDKKPSSRQGTDKEVIWRTYKTESILGVARKKTFYEVI